MSLWTIVVTFAVLFAITAIGYFVLYFVVAPRSAAARGITRPEEVAAHRDALLRGPVQFGAGTIAAITLLFTVGNGIATFRESADQQANQQFFNAAQMAVSGTADHKTDTATSSDKTTGTATPSENLKTAAIYSLKNIVLANPEYCDMVTSILLGQINANTRRRNADPRSLPFRVDPSISAAVLVLGTIPPCLRGRSIRLIDEYLAGADFGGTRYFARADFRASTLWAAHLGWANFDYAHFDGANMADGDAFFSSYGKSEHYHPRKFEVAKKFNVARLSYNWRFQKYNYIANFENSSLRCATFLNTSVAGASFANADLYGVNFGNTNLSGVDFTGVKNLRTVKLDNACFNEDEKPVLDKGQEWFITAVRRQNCSSDTERVEVKADNSQSFLTGSLSLAHVRGCELFPDFP